MDVGIGMLFSKYYKKIIEFRLILISLSACILISNFEIPGNSGNKLNLFYFMTYASLIFCLSFYLKPINLKIDISYGVYVWHMIAVNLLIVVDQKNIIYALIITTICSYLSWKFVEERALKLKKITIHII